eukprot:2098514-Pyramimonas_sp.AAC.1
MELNAFDRPTEMLELPLAALYILENSDATGNAQGAFLPLARQEAPRTRRCDGRHLLFAKRAQSALGSSTSPEGVSRLTLVH